MQYHGKYEVNPKDIVDGTIKWESTGSGAYIIAEYKGVKYFVKRFTMGPRIPGKDIMEPAYSLLLKPAKWLETKQEDIRKLFNAKGISVDKDHVVIEEENFWDDSNMLTTVTRLIPNEVKGYDFSKLGFDVFLKLCVDMATLLVKIHDAGVTHGDLKVKNFIIQQNGAELVPYLIDFDSSYPSDYATKTQADGTPLLACPVVFSEGYQSPEIAIYNFNYEEGEECDASTITNKTDIFTLAIIFHELWTGRVPAVVGESCAVGEAVYMDKELKLDPKFDIELGSDNNCKFSSLLMWMLSKDINQRPTAQQVVDALNDMLDIDELFESTDSALKFDLDPHTAHQASLEIYTKDTLRKKNVKAFCKITVGGAFKYLVKLKDGSEQQLSIDDVVAKGYGKYKKTAICELWESDAEVIEFLPEDKIAEQGVIAIEQRGTTFKKFYYVALRSGGGYTSGREGLVDRGLAKRKVVVDADSVDTDSPWPEHGSMYDKKALAERHVTKVEKVTEDGENKYRITIKNGGSTIQNVVKAGFMKIMGYIK